MSCRGYADRSKLNDPFYKLEHIGEDTAKGKKQAPLLVRLQEASDMKHYDSYARNKALRAQLRVCVPSLFCCGHSTEYLITHSVCL